MIFTDDDRASWTFVEGSISVSASILIADGIARCSRCADWPIIGFFKQLTEQEDGVIIAGMALLFPTAFAFYLGVKMVFAAYREYRNWREAREASIKQAEADARAAGHAEGRAEGHLEGRAEGHLEGRAEGRAEGHLEGRAEGHGEGYAEGRNAERDRLKREFAARGISLPPEAERILHDEPDADS